MKKEEDNNIEEQVEEVKDNKIQEKNENSDLETLKAQLKEEKEKSDEYYEHLKRNMAEFDNYKKRISKEKDMMYNTISADIISELLPILDNFDKALNAETLDESYKNGMAMIYNQFNDTLQKLGVEEIDALNKVFDPNFHEAVMQTPTSEHPENTVISVMQKGYKVGDKVLRPALVNVASAG